MWIGVFTSQAAVRSKQFTQQTVCTASSAFLAGLLETAVGRAKCSAGGPVLWLIKTGPFNLAASHRTDTAMGQIGDIESLACKRAESGPVTTNDLSLLVQSSTCYDFMTV